MPSHRRMRRSLRGASCDGHRLGRRRSAASRQGLRQARRVKRDRLGSGVVPQITLSHRDDRTRIEESLAVCVVDFEDSSLNLVAHGQPRIFHSESGTYVPSHVVVLEDHLLLKPASKQAIPAWESRVAIGSACAVQHSIDPRAVLHPPAGNHHLVFVAVAAEGNFGGAKVAQTCTGGHPQIRLSHVIARKIVSDAPIRKGLYIVQCSHRLLLGAIDKREVHAVGACRVFHPRIGARLHEVVVPHRIGVFNNWVDTVVIACCPVRIAGDVDHG